MGLGLPSLFKQKQKNMNKKKEANYNQIIIDYMAGFVPPPKTKEQILNFILKFKNQLPWVTIQKATMPEKTTKVIMETAQKWWNFRNHYWSSFFYG